MKINFTKNEYRALIDLLALGDWMMHSHAIEPSEFYSTHYNLVKRLFAYAKEMDCEDILEYSKDLDGYFETADYDEKLQEQFIEPYEDECFWYKLIDRLAVRDVLEQLGVDKFRSLELAERLSRVDEVKAKYHAEFQQRGVENLVLRNNKADME